MYRDARLSEEGRIAARLDARGVAFTWGGGWGQDGNTAGVVHMYACGKGWACLGWSGGKA